MMDIKVIVLGIGYFVFLGLIEELHFRLATGKSSHWWMCNQRIVKRDKVLDAYDFKKNWGVHMKLEKHQKENIIIFVLGMINSFILYLIVG